MPLKAGIFFAGPSREREIAFAGGRTVYDNLDKSLFEPVPIFVDSQRRLILLNWEFVYKGTIRDFYPPVSFLPESPNEFQIYVESLGEMTDAEADEMISHVGRRISLDELPQLIDFAFLSLHGAYGEDGQIQGLLDSLQIPYTGSGIRACAIGMDKAYQKKLMEASGFDCPEVMIISKREWIVGDSSHFYAKAKEKIEFPLVIRPANQGSSIGVSIVKKDSGESGFQKLVNKAFFRDEILAADWKQYNPTEKADLLRSLTDIREGIGFPLDIAGNTIYHPENLLTFLDDYFEVKSHESAMLESHFSEQKVVAEAFIHGKEFSCIVLRDEEGKVIALPPTEIVKGEEVFDYRSKYMPGLSRKLTPIHLPNDKINAIRKECERLFEFLEFNCYARIDGFIQEDGKIFLNDPNTTSGMLPSSFFFHQAAEIGLNPSQFLSFIIRSSIQERIASSMDKLPHYESMMQQLDEAILNLHQGQQQKKKIAVLLGGYSFERHISVESGRNVFEKLASSEKYDAFPVFLTGNQNEHELYQLPMNLLLKDNADDIRDKIYTYKEHPAIEDIKLLCENITRKYASGDVVFAPRKLDYQSLANLFDGVFIALHGRPGEDGTVQQKLDALNMPYNGSHHDSSSITIDKYETLQTLKQHGFTVTDQLLVTKANFGNDKAKTIAEVEDRFSYPFIAKPVDDGCSSAVLMIRSREQLAAYFEAIFREEVVMDAALETKLGLRPKEEFPQKDTALIETLIQPEGAKHFLEITGGLLTHMRDGKLEYELFEPSEALAGGEVLSLEEKFLAGEGQNITPARFADNTTDYAYIAAQVKADLERAARILKVKGYARIDAFVRIFEDNRAETIIVEINSLPGMTPATCIFHQCAINGYKPFEFIDKILEFGFGEQKRIIVDKS